MKAVPLVLSLLLVASVANAQRLTETRMAAATPAPLPEGSSAKPRDSGAGRAGSYPRNAEMAWTGAVFAAGGIYAGAYIGATAACGNMGRGEDYCELDGGVLGALLGEMIMLPLGVHTASSRSPYRRKLLASSAVMLAGMILAPVTAGISLLAVPPFQLMAAMHVEQREIARASER